MGRVGGNDRGISAGALVATEREHRIPCRTAGGMVGSAVSGLRLTPARQAGVLLGDCPKLNSLSQKSWVYT